MPLPDSFVEELKTRCDIVDIVSSYVNLRKAGRNMVGLCPFHGEKTPSFNVYSENGSFYCFGCGAGGDVITFVRRVENLDYMEAVRFLAGRAGLQVPEGHVDDGMAKLKARILEVNREAARFFHASLSTPQGAPGMEYLQGRGLSQKTINHFGLGYAPPGRTALAAHLKARGFTETELYQANVAFQGRNGGPVDRFFSRVMYPIIDLRGNIIAFGGRILTDEKPKYLNTSDTPVFNKSHNLFALNFAKGMGGQPLILAEGYMDVIALHQAGFTNAVATLGTALTQEQARLMAKYTQEVVVCYDSDEAGQKASARAIPMLRDAGLHIRVLTIVGGKDPDEYIRSFGEQGPARFKQLLEACGNDVEYRLQKIKSKVNLQTAQGRVEYLTGAAEVLATLDNPIECEVYAGRLAEEIGIDSGAILTQVKKLAAKRQKTGKQKEFREFQNRVTGVKDKVNPEKAENLRAASAEEALLAYLCRYPEGTKAVRAALPPEKFCTAFNRRVYEALLGKMLSGKIMTGRAVSLTELSEDFSEEEISVIAGILARHHEVSATEKDKEEYIQVIAQEYAAAQARRSNAQSQDIEDYLKELKAQKK